MILVGGHAGIGRTGSGSNPGAEVGNAVSYKAPLKEPLIKNIP